MGSPGGKGALREQVRASRRAGPAADPRALADRCLHYLRSLPGPLRVTCYSSYGTEPETSALLDSLVAAGYEVLLPRVEGDDLAWIPHGEPLAVPRTEVVDPATQVAKRGGSADPTATQVAKRGGSADPTATRIAEPAGDPVALLPLRAMLVPALAAAIDGARLGKGGGYYDRVLATLHDVPADARPAVVALVRDEDVLPAGSIPMEPHDQRVDVVITPTRVARCESPSGRRSRPDG